MGLPILVIALSSLVFFTGWGVPSGTSNNGTLINPPKLLSEYGIEFQAPDSPLNKPIWTLLQIAANGCDSSCEETLVYARQVRTSLGRRTPGLSRLLWVPDAVTVQAKLKDEHKDLIVATLPSSDKLTSLFGDIEPREGNYFYLVDPHGFAMMYYTPDQTYKEIIGDLKFLITQSGY